MTSVAEDYWTAGFLNERFPAPVSPLGWSVLGPLFDEYALRDPLRFMGYPGAEVIPTTFLRRGHPYANVLIFQILYNPFPNSLLPDDAVRYFPGGEVSWRKRAPYPRSTFNPRFIVSMIAHFVRDPLNWSPFNFVQWRRYEPRHGRIIAELNARLDNAKQANEILEVIASANQSHANLLRIHRWSLTYADLFFKLLEDSAGIPAQALVADVPNLTHEINRELEVLADLAAANHLHFDTADQVSEALAHPLFGEAVGRFQIKHGHRSFSLDIEQPTFRDEPSIWLRLLKALPVATGASSPGQYQASAAFVGMSPIKRFLISILLRFARIYSALREDQRYYWQKSLAVARRAYLLLALKIKDQIGLESTSHIFYATSGEISEYLSGRLSGGDLGRVIQDRRQEWASYREEYTRSPSASYPEFLRGDSPLEGTSIQEGNVWQGRGVSPGKASGSVRVILDASDLARVLAGEVLVAPTTDPGWTSVFSRLSAVVVERGGILSHSAIIAREYRLPAVASIPNVTREVADGDWVEVDGTLGLVRRLNR